MPDLPTRPRQGCHTGVVAFANGCRDRTQFLVRDGSWHTPDLPFRHIRQFYLTPPDNPLSIRIRIVDHQSAVITLKSTAAGVIRDEYEYAIPLDDAQALIASATGSLIEKTRFIRTEGSASWEIDRFEGENAGLVVAEIELSREDAPITPPDWIGEEVTDEARYGNAALSRLPFTRW